MGSFAPSNEETDITDCSPIITNRDADVTIAVDGTHLDPDAPAYPCGLEAKSFFNDTFAIYTQNPEEEGFDPSSKIEIDSSDIAWKLDVDYGFNNMKDEPYT